jgi:hypothetical protein
MDLGSAAILGAVVVGLVALARSLIFGVNRDRIIAGTCLAIGIGATWLVGASDFASEQVVLDKPLDQLNFWSQMLVGVLVAGVASAGWQGYKAIANVGENQP